MLLTYGDAYYLLHQVLITTTAATTITVGVRYYC